MRPAFWPNTPDILGGVLRDGPPSAFALRLVLAATLVPTYGVYSGYELYENAPASETNEEYLHSEKYDITHRDYSMEGSLAPLMRTLTALRRCPDGVFPLRAIRFHHSHDDSFLAYTRSPEHDALHLTVVNLCR